MADVAILCKYIDYKKQYVFYRKLLSISTSDWSFT